MCDIGWSFFRPIRDKGPETMSLCVFDSKPEDCKYLYRARDYMQWNWLDGIVVETRGYSTGFLQYSESRTMHRFYLCALDLTQSAHVEVFWQKHLFYLEKLHMVIFIIRKSLRIDMEAVFQ